MKKTQYLHIDNAFIHNTITAAASEQVSLMPSNGVSAVIPTYNRADCVVNAIESARGQSFALDEIIVVIDGSSDRTTELLRDYRKTLSSDDGRRVSLIYQDNLGVSAARNHGIRLSNSQFIALLDDDDTWHHNKIATQMAAVNQLSIEVPWICTTDYIAHTATTGCAQLVECTRSMDLIGQMQAKLFPPPSCWLFNRRAYDETGGFDEILHAGEDVDFITKLRRAKATFYNIGTPLTNYNEAPGKVYRNQQESAVRVLLRHHDWWKTHLPEIHYQEIMIWYKSVLPHNTYNMVIGLLKTSHL